MSTVGGAPERATDANQSPSAVGELRRAAVWRAHEAAATEQLHGFVTVADQPAVARDLEAALVTPPRGSADPLWGQPLAVKDNIHVAGLPNTAGTPALAGFVPEHDAGAVARLRARGMVVIGKTNMHELALGVTSTHTLIGPVVNAVDATRIAGGSSGGTGAVVGAGICELALGSDTGGSTRIPAVYNDCWGFRPSTGRYDADGTTGLAFSRDTIGPMTATLAGLAALDEALALRSESPRAGVVRLGYDPADVALCDPEVAVAFEDARAAIAASGLELVSIDLAPIDAGVGAWEPLLGAQELASTLRAYLSDYAGLPSFDELVAQLVDPHVAHLIEGSVEATRDGVWNAQWHTLLTEIARVRSAYLRLLATVGVTAVIRPAVPELPRFVSEVMAMSLAERSAHFGRSTRFARLATVVGGPSLAVPLGPLLGHHHVGLLVEGAPGDDPEVFEAARGVEQALRAAAH